MAKFPSLRAKLDSEYIPEEASPYEYDEGAGGAELFKSLVGDKAPPSEFEQGGGGIQESMSPIDLITPGMVTKPVGLLGRGAIGLGKEVVEAAPRILGNEVGALGDWKKQGINLSSKSAFGEQFPNIKKYEATAPEVYTKEMKDKLSLKELPNYEKNPDYNPDYSFQIQPDGTFRRVIGSSEINDVGNGNLIPNTKVHPDYQRKGIATAIYQMAEDEMKGKMGVDPRLGSQSLLAQKLWGQPNRPFGNDIPKTTLSEKSPETLDKWTKMMKEVDPNYSPELDASFLDHNAPDYEQQYKAIKDKQEALKKFK